MKGVSMKSQPSKAAWSKSFANRYFDYDKLDEPHPGALMTPHGYGSYPMQLQFSPSPFGHPNSWMNMSYQMNTPLFAAGGQHWLPPGNYCHYLYILLSDSEVIFDFQ
ncbi:unnamed protein product [Cuscuta europaea]|uniref:Uncharacterized protein n=1 Tax=Cuscuta europaea TaxID=41803 RepID=A0A9P0YQH5_CUSEU|nr:unnamed protein product [Cuscuta europaea]